MFIALLAIALHSSSFPRPARADELLQPRLLLTLRYSDDLVFGTEGKLAIQRVEISAPRVPRECKPRYMAGPAVGLVLGVYAVAFGTVVKRDGFAYPKQRDPMHTGWGAALIAAGLGTFVYSSVRLAKNRHARRRVCGTGTQRDKQRAHVESAR